MQSLKVLVIDDEKLLRMTLSDYLEDLGHITFTAENGLEGIEKIKDINPDFIFVDLNMPVLDGYAVIDFTKNNFGKTPIVVISGAGLINDAIKAVSKGAWDYITKPVTDMDVIFHVLEKNHEKAVLINENEAYKNNLEQMVDKRTLELQMEIEKRKTAEQTLIKLNTDILETQKEILWTLGEVVENRSKETGNHVKRVAEISLLIALEYGLSEADALMLKHASPMHDIGKIGIEDNILNKPGKLTPEEYEKIKSHTEIGALILSKSNQSLMKIASIVAHEHHEYWDGGGYPRGLKGEDIHIFGRITCIADVYDALNTKRIYKDKWEINKTLDYILDNSGKLFDPKIVESFFRQKDKILKVSSFLGD